jgi:hypothetical protein
MTPLEQSDVYTPLQEQSLFGIIHHIRGVQIILDRDLALLYQVDTRTLKQAVKRNRKRFPGDFMFVLDDAEVDLMVSQSVIPSKRVLGGSMPFAFTEQGVASLSSVLTSDRAIDVNIAIMRTFVSMRRVHMAYSGMLQRIDSIEQKLLNHEMQSMARFETVFEAMSSGRQNQVQGVFFDGQIFDAYVFVSDLLRKAESSIVLIDNYVDESVLMHLTKRKPGVSATILTREIGKTLQLDLKKHNAQYDPISIREFANSHDRFLILDGKTVYHLGASLKDLGKKWVAFSKMDSSGLTVMERIAN